MNKNKVYSVGVFSRYWISTHTATTNTKTIVRINSFIKGLYNDITDEILLNNYTLSCADLYYVKFRRYSRNFDRMAVNFPASNILKKEILARGDKLAVKIGVTEKGNPIFSEGFKWLVFFTDPYFVAAVFDFRPVNVIITDKEGNEKIKQVIPRKTLVWKPKASDKLLSRFLKYETLGKISKLNIPLTDGSKNNLL